MSKKKDKIDKRGISDAEHRRVIKKYGNRFYPVPGHEGETVVIFIGKKKENP